MFVLSSIVSFNRLCTDLQTLIHERAEIEKAYAKSLRAWSKKWGELIEKGMCAIIEVKQFQKFTAYLGHMT